MTTFQVVGVDIPEDQGRARALVQKVHSGTYR